MPYLKKVGKYDFLDRCEELFWAAIDPRVEPIGRAMSRLVKRRKGLFWMIGEKVVPLGLVGEKKKPPNS